ncbi:MAG: VWA domain-containing protein, partial [Anaerolineae bacterium]
MMPVTFIWPLALFSLALVPVFAIVYGLLQVRRRRIIAQYGNLGLLQNVSVRRLGFARHLPAIFLLAGLTLLLIAAARPETQVRLPRVEGTVMLAFDVSGSMAADDMQPTRMEAAKAAARAFVQQQPTTVQVGIVAFSDSGFSVQVPTDDKDAVLSAINRLTPQRGTSLANGILVSLKAIATANDDSTHFYSPTNPGGTPAPTPVPAGHYDSSVIVLLTDGENNEQPDPMAAAKAAADRGVRVYTVGLGSPIGTTLHINGFTVRTQLDEQTLQRISQATGGTYYNAESAQDLTRIYANLDPQLVVKPEKIEVTSIF